MTLKKPTLMHRAINLLAKKDYTSKQMYDKLIVFGDVPEVLETLARLQEKKLIDDEQFQYDYYEYSIKQAKGHQRIIRSLAEKGIDIKDETIFEGYHDQEVEMAYQLALRRYEAKSALTHRHAINKVRQILLQRGYSYSIIDEVIERLPMRSNEAQLIEKEFQKALLKYQKKFIGYELRQRMINYLLTRGFTFDEINRKLLEEEI